jgi:hypothetical protein
MLKRITNPTSFSDETIRANNMVPILLVLTASNVSDEILNTPLLAQLGEK